ncbi:MAG: hypothetical protein ACOC46_01325, partial [Pirellulales bacterium]
MFRLVADRRLVAAAVVLAVATISLPVAIAGPRTSRAERQRRVQSMSAAQREQLRRNFERFQELSPAERARLRRLQEKIDADPDREALLELIEVYHEWVRTLSPPQRRELLNTPPEARLEKVKQLVAERRRRSEREARGRGGSGRAHFEALARLMRWLDDWAEAHMTPAQRADYRRADRRAAYRAFVQMMP